ncbi:MAG TPA: universal stress protein [Thermoanaerobaculia bacterium]|jgi:nucleotide-binding universal stress UspA family protein
MVAIRTVLCPVDLSAASARQVDLAAQLCRLFAARLVVHHNLATLPVGAAVGWMWQGGRGEAPTEDDVEARVRALLARLPGGVEHEARITRGLPSQTVMAVGDLVGADLVILATHGDSHQEHTSVTEQLLEHSERSLLVLHERDVASGPPDFLSPGSPHVALVPTDLAAGSRGAEELACELAARAPVELHLLHVAEPKRRGEPQPDDIETAMRARLPEALVGKARLHVAEGDPAAAIDGAARRLGAGCIVMGEHTKSFLRRWLSPDVSRALLHQAPCPVWYVPAGRAGAA